MAQKKFFVVLGLGSFGSALAERLSKNGCRVTGVDANRDRVENLKDVLYEAVVGDVSARDTLAELSLDACDAVFISLGENQNITPSVLATLHCRELGAKRIIVKGLSRDHAKILEAMGARGRQAALAQHPARSSVPRWPARPRAGGARCRRRSPRSCRT